MYFDWTYIILVLPAVLFAAWAQAKVTSTYAKYEKVGNSRRITGAQAAQFILSRSGVTDVRIEPIAGSLTDHFDPTQKVIRLSEGVYDRSSIAAVGIACHEAGHAIQHAVDYAPIKIRAAIIPITNFGSKLAMPLILIGLLLCALSPAYAVIAYIGVGCFALSTVFQLVTLPTEFDASKRALRLIGENNLLMGDEYSGAKKVLAAAAMTYVAAMAVSLMQLLRFIILIGGSSNRR